jgi:NhaP-type Na+/H+ or K+/H+ antiporter
MAHYFTTNTYILILLAFGIMAMVAAIVPVLLRKKYFSAPIVYLLLGGITYILVIPLKLKPLENLPIIEHITEFVILVALANTGMRIKEPFAWRTWKYAFRLLAIAMPLTIVAASFLGWWAMGFAPATAMLFGALIAPTDPVLASELQTSEPGKPDSSQSKLGLTAEAGINDGLAFPFTYFAIMYITKGANYQDWIGEWFLHEFVLKIVLGVGIGLAMGWLFYKLVVFISSKYNEKLDGISKGILSLSVTFIPYAVSEIVGGYGFLAVFFAACMFSRCEKLQHHINSLHDFNEELESLVVAAIFIATGFFIALHYQLLFDPYILGTALFMVLVVRPLAGWLSLVKTGLNPFQKIVLSFYGIRGIGSIFYLAYALNAANFPQAEKLIAVTTATIFFSVLIHGITARAVQKRIKKYDSTEETI